jgi:hypothetical protein
MRYYFTGDIKMTNKFKTIRGLSYIKDSLHLSDYPVNVVTESTYGENGRAEARVQDEIDNKFIHEIIYFT